MPYKGVPVLLTTWTRCSRCRCVVEHLEQSGHDEWHAWLDRLAAKVDRLIAGQDDEPEPVLERAC